MKVLVAGASGSLGKAVCAQLLARGCSVRALVRNANTAPNGTQPFVADALVKGALAHIGDDVTHVFSCLGAPVSPSKKGRAGFDAVDVPANLALLEAVAGKSVARIVYVSAHHDADLRRLTYFDAHERVAEAVRKTGVSSAIIRPTGFFGAFAEFIPMAQKGSLPIFGDGSARTNPIAEEDLATVCVDALLGQGGDVDVGGPDTLSRADIATLAFEALGLPVRLRFAPLWAAQVATTLIHPFHPRLAQSMAFIAAVSTRDAVAPAYGQRRLVDAFRALAAQAGKHAS